MGDGVEVLVGDTVGNDVIVGMRVGSSVNVGGAMVGEGCATHAISTRTIGKDRNSDGFITYPLMINNDVPEYPATLTIINN